MSVRTFQMRCRKCGGSIRLTRNRDEFDKFMRSDTFDCDGRHFEETSPTRFLTIIEISEPSRPTTWAPAHGRKYVDVLDRELAWRQRMDLRHLGFGIFKDERTGKKYDYEYDSSGEKHYYEMGT